MRNKTTAFLALVILIFILSLTSVVSAECQYEIKGRSCTIGYSNGILNYLSNSMQVAVPAGNYTLVYQGSSTKAGSAWPYTLRYDSTFGARTVNAYFTGSPNEPDINNWITIPNSCMARTTDLGYWNKGFGSMEYAEQKYFSCGVDGRVMTMELNVEDQGGGMGKIYSWYQDDVCSDNTGLIWFCANPVSEDVCGEGQEGYAREWDYQAYVFDNFGNKVENAKVEVYDGESLIKSLETNEEGLTKIANIEEYVNCDEEILDYKDYEIKVSHEGYSEQVLDVQLTKNFFIHEINLTGNYDLSIEEVLPIQVVENAKYFVEGRPAMVRVVVGLERFSEVDARIKLEILEKKDNGKLKSVWSETKEQEVKKKEEYSLSEIKQGNDSVNFFPDFDFKKNKVYVFRASVEPIVKPGDEKWMIEDDKDNNQKETSVKVGYVPKNLRIIARAVRITVGTDVYSVSEAKTKEIIKTELDFAKKILPFGYSQYNDLDNLKKKDSDNFGTCNFYWARDIDTPEERKELLEALVDKCRLEVDIDKLKKKYPNDIIQLVLVIPHALADSAGGSASHYGSKTKVIELSDGEPIPNANIVNARGFNSGALAHELGHALANFGEDYTEENLGNALSDGGWCLNADGTSCDFNWRFSESDSGTIKGRVVNVYDKEEWPLVNSPKGLELYEGRDENEMRTYKGLGPRFLNFMGREAPPSVWIDTDSYNKLIKKLVEFGK